MRVVPTALNELQMMPETETEQFFVDQFLRQWRIGYAKITLKSGMDDSEPQNTLEVVSRFLLSDLPSFTKN